jgi:hypothetical protein
MTTLLLAKTPPHETKAGRQALVKKKQALSDGSFPIPNLSYLKKALKAVGRATPGKRPVLAALIRKRAKVIPGGLAVLKGSWADNTQSAKAMANALREALELAATAPPASGNGLTGVALQVYNKLKAGAGKSWPDARRVQFAKNAANLAARKKKPAGKA